MRLISIPKYTKYNEGLKPVRIASVQPKRKNKLRYQSNQTVVPITIDPFRVKPSRRVRIKDSVINWYSRSIQAQPKQKPLTRFQKIFKRDEDSYRCKLSQWYARKRALRALKYEHKKELKKLKSLDKWKLNEARLIAKAQKEKLQAEREAEVATQLWEIEKARAKLASDALKTRYPYKVEKRTVQTDDTYQRYYNTDFDKNDVEDENTYKEYYQQYNDVTPYSDAYQSDYYAEEPKPAKKKKRGLFKLGKFKPFKFKRKVKKEKPPKVKKYKEPKIKKYKEPKIKKVKPPKVKKVKPPKVKKVKPPKVKKVKPPKVKKEKQKYADSTDEYYSETVYEEPTTKKKRKKREKKQKAAKYKDITIPKHKPRKSFDERFVNCFYKSCCEFYCWLTIILVIGVVIILIV